MIELYVGATLLGIGYLLKQQQGTPRIQIPNQQQVNVKELNSFKSPYDNNYHKIASSTETLKASEVYKAARANPDKVVMKDKDAYITSPLTGNQVLQSNFVHNNMKPYGRVKALNVDANRQPVFEKFTGTQTYYTPKSEVKNMFEPTLNVGNVNGTKVNTDFFMERIAKPVAQNNVLPFSQVTVGPALNRGYGSQPEGGYQQLDARDYAMPKTVDELRVGSNPKTTFKGRVVDGQKGARRGIVGTVDKNRPDTYYCNNPDRYFKTTGAFLKPTQQPQPIDKYTNRQDTTTSYSGVPFMNAGQVQKGKMREPLKEQLAAYDVGQPVLTAFRNQAKEDYGKANILVYANERDVTTTRTHQGNITSMVKALVAPIQDLIKSSKKEYMVDAAREFGNLQPNYPNKQTVYNPNDVARTTIKETLLTESQFMNYAGPVKATVYDPNNVARTTIKETTLDASQNMNLKGANKITVYDPNSIARTTIKETTLQDSEVMNLKGANKITVYDPNSIARTTIKETTLQDSEVMNLKGATKTHVFNPNSIAKTTIKETTLHDADQLNLKGDRNNGIVYDPNMKAKTTNRQTLEDTDTVVNLAGRKAHIVYDPSDPARTTHKETLVDAPRVYGNVDRAENFQGAYENEIYDVPNTQRNEITDEYMGNPAQPSTDGYQVTDAVPRNTQKQVISDNDYYGTAAIQTSKAPMSYQDIYNATIDELKEELLIGREPTQTSVKVASGGDTVIIQSRRQDITTDQDAILADRITNVPLDSKDAKLTRMPQDYKNNNQLDAELLKPFQENPYTQSLQSFI